MTYSSTLSFLYNLQKHGIKLGLDTIECLLARLGRPEREYPAFHIGGTNGKGSTAAMTAAMLQAAGYRVGLYTSPHLVDFRERIRVNGQSIGEEPLMDFVERVRSAAGRAAEPTFFEFTTAVALEYFKTMRVDVAVIEVGMGGRFDATNVLTPVVSAITNVTLDHQAYLGTTVAEIAFEKAGIIKPGVPVVVGRVEPDAWETIERAVSTRGAHCSRWDLDFRAEGDPLAGFRYTSRVWEYSGLTCPLPGRHQLENAGCALAMMEAAAEQGFRVSEGAVRRGLGSVAWEGRLEAVEHDPLVVLDGAHNPAAACAVADYLKRFRTMRGGRVVLVTGFMQDKDHRGFLSAVLPYVDEVVLTRVQMSRAATVEELSESLQGWPGLVHTTTHSGDALAHARRITSARDMICITGSLMLVGEIKALLRGCEVSLLRG